LAVASSSVAADDIDAVAAGSVDLRRLSEDVQKTEKAGASGDPRWELG
jgi:hypothetical protein